MCNYGYYENFNYAKGGYQEKYHVKFMVLGGKKDGIDNFFKITVSSVEDFKVFSETDDIIPTEIVPFDFMDGTQGQRKTKI